ncbi:hypothetical protein GQ55_6G253900 [Panicum hallii var. hallii]|uniref:Uncharacterized protein n=2 Tax=Panicum hallii TaxID=206008 RepID=A0A2T7D9G6_9POAL|nr:uncharacterized protein LOC112896980 [Panicum hallii]PAN36180.1 hypothetical protein PAHAL_6G265100 [Panicum hallii]PUZ52232.1 hypothetical protein GQ55_6G253900 [Panicum hallii var. hallii]
MRLAATKPAAIFITKRQPVPTPRARVAAAAAAGPCSEAAKKSRSDGASWRIAVASSDAEADGGGGEGDAEAGQVAPGRARGRRARLSARRRESVRLPAGVSGGDVGEFLRHPDGVESLLNTGALESFAPAGAGPGTFTCALRRIGFLGFEVAPVLELRVAPTSTDCTVEMLSCRFEGSESIEQQNELFSAFMSNRITWSDDGEEPRLDIDVTLEVTLEVYTKPFSMLPLSAVETPGNLLMQGLLDRLVPVLGEQLLRDYHSWVQQQPEASS